MPLEAQQERPASVTGLVTMAYSHTCTQFEEQSKADRSRLGAPPLRCPLADDGRFDLLCCLSNALLGERLIYPIFPHSSRPYIEAFELKQRIPPSAQHGAINPARFTVHDTNTLHQRTRAKCGHNLARSLLPHFFRHANRDETPALRNKMT